MAKNCMVLITEEAHAALKAYCSEKVLTFTKTASELIIAGIERKRQEAEKTATFTTAN